MTAWPQPHLPEHAIAFDEAFPEYGTRHGVLPSDDPRRGTAPPLLWVDTLDRMFETMANDGVNIEMISTSTIRISCVVAEDDVERAVRSLHAAFGLDKE